MDLKIGSTNVRGIVDEVKQQEISNCTIDNEHDWRAECGYQALFCCGSSRKAGFAILLREDPPENQAILKYESTSTLSDFVYISHETTY